MANEGAEAYASRFSTLTSDSLWVCSLVSEQQVEYFIPEKQRREDNARHKVPRSEIETIFLDHIATEHIRNADGIKERNAYDLPGFHLFYASPSGVAEV